MFIRSRTHIIIALLTSGLLIAYAFYERGGGTVIVPQAAFYVAAVLIFMAPRLFCRERYRDNVPASQ